MKEVEALGPRNWAKGRVALKKPVSSTSVSQNWDPKDSADGGCRKTEIYGYYSKTNRWFWILFCKIWKVKRGKDNDCVKDIESHSEKHQLYVRILAFNPSTWATEADQSQVWGWSRLYSKFQSQRKHKEINQNNKKERKQNKTKILHNSSSSQKIVIKRIVIVFSVLE